MEFSRRMEYFKPGIFSVLAQMKSDRLTAGKRVIDLSVGTPNIPPAQHIVDALVESARNRRNYIYALSDTAELQETVSAWYRKRYGVEIDPRTETTSLLGSQDGLAHIALSIVDEGDTVLVQDPGYPIFSDGPVLAGAKLCKMPQKAENGWLIDLDAIPEAVAKKAKFMIVSYPNNPVTSLAPPAFYRALVDFAHKYGIIVLHDNAYSELVFDGRTCGSFLSYDGAKEIGVEFNSLSKTYGLAGARIGFALGNPTIIAMLKALKSNLDYGMFLPIQKAAVAALTGPQDCVAVARCALRNAAEHPGGRPEYHRLADGEAAGDYVRLGENPGEIQEERAVRQRTPRPVGCPCHAGFRVRSGRRGLCPPRTGTGRGRHARRHPAHRRERDTEINLHFTTKSTDACQCFSLYITRTEASRTPVAVIMS